MKNLMGSIKIFRTLLFVFSFFYSILSIAQTPFKLTVFRQYPSKKCTSGYLAVNDKIICYTLERPWADNKKNVSSIPAGEYGAILRYDHTDHWRIELLKVPGPDGKERDNVQIHIGNTVDNTIGCILVGMKLEADLCTIKGGTSAEAYAALKEAFYDSKNPTSTPNKTITVKISE